jgi:hypothetical protein
MPGLHVTAILRIYPSTTRMANCHCGWNGPQRATIELAADDALIHEESDHHVVKKPATRDGIKRMAGHDFLGPTLDPKFPRDSCSICGGPRSEHPR